MHARDYFRRYTDDAIDLCDVLSSFDARSKVSLNDLCRVLALPGKPDGMDGSQVERYVNEGRIAEVSAYCETDVVNTYRAFLIHELFAGRLTHETHDTSEDDLRHYLSTKMSAKAHYSSLIELRASIDRSMNTPTPGMAELAFRAQKVPRLDGDGEARAQDQPVSAAQDPGHPAKPSLGRAYNMHPDRACRTPCALGSRQTTQASICRRQARKMIAFFQQIGQKIGFLRLYLIYCV